MKKIILSALILSMAVAVQAQDKDHRRGGKRGHHGQVMEKLNLSEEQKAKFKAENEAFRNQVADLKKNENITVTEFKSKMETIRKDHKSYTQNILTAEQKKLYAELKEKREAKMKDHAKRKGHRPGFK